MRYITLYNTLITNPSILILDIDIGYLILIFDIGFGYVIDIDIGY